MNYSSNLEGLYKAAYIDPYEEAARRVVRRTRERDAARSKGTFTNDEFDMDQELMDAILDRYMHPSIRSQFDSDLKSMLAEESAARAAGKNVEHPIMYRNGYLDPTWELDERALGTVLNHTLSKPLDSDPNGDIAENLNGRYYYKAHVDSDRAPEKGSMADIPFIEKLNETNYKPILPGLGITALATTLAGADEGAAAGVSTGIGGALGALTGGYVMDSLGYGLPRQIQHGNILGSILGSGLGYTGYNLISALGSDGRKKKKDKKDKKDD